MREIKFRAWDKWNDCYEDHLHRVMVKLNGDTYNSEYGDDQNYRYEIEQFTGLHDCNGVEIYEGDIVESDAMLPSEMCFDKSGFCFSFGDWPICDYFVVNDERSLKVIGNQHQNPELLK